ncbi:sigma-54-dependent transcriptional regulator [Agaribacterium sp. ZY112]|uniref:sigma-54-dependent transcriptional regulator n=1 Tax=Agaribacterium sp. ZY112 TaxID=3233574 RepID=UPI0035269FD0
MAEQVAPLCILVADDQGDIRRSAELLFKSEGIQSRGASSPAQVERAIKEQVFDLILLDMNYQSDTTSGHEGLNLIELIRKQHEHVPIVVMTAWASVEMAVEAMKLGANDFICKPWDVERLLSIVKTQVALTRALQRQSHLESENRILKEQQKTELSTNSAVMKDLVQDFECMASSDAGLLLSGENGTGKTRMARLCHDLSDRKGGPFISVNMGALAESVFESEIFGHEKGAFTGADAQRIGRYELADGGTLFLDEIANITEKQQAVLLHLLETGEFERVGSSRTRSADVRIICATNADLQQEVSEGRFRQDLFYRINTLSIRIPALRERVEDIPVLADYFLVRFKEKYNKSELGFSDSAYQLMQSHSWPGNIRELEHSIERAVLLSRGAPIGISELGLAQVEQSTHSSGLGSLTSSEYSFEGKTLAQVEYDMLDAALVKHMRKPDEAAKALGVSRSAFYRKLSKHGFDLS